MPLYLTCSRCRGHGTISSPDGTPVACPDCQS